MCTRYQADYTEEELQKRYQLGKVPPPMYPKAEGKISYNAGPTHLLPVITDERPEEVQYFRWGLIPAGAGSSNLSFATFNARCETLEEKPTFRGLLANRRCIVPATGFYEWLWLDADGKEKQPFLFMTEEKIFSFAGLWTVAEIEGKEIFSFTIITTEPNQTVMPVQDRMPVILNPEDENNWLAPGLPRSDYEAVLRPYGRHMTKRKVNRALGDLRNNGSWLMEPGEVQGKLF